MEGFQKLNYLDPRIGYYETGPNTKMILILNKLYIVVMDRKFQ